MGTPEAALYGVGGVVTAAIPEQVFLRLDELSANAWRVRASAHLHGRTMVGAAALSSSGVVHVGCNVEHRFRSHDIHAETNALGSMVAAGDRRASAVLVASERDHFTPCGACLDWIFELGGAQCLVIVESSPQGERKVFTAAQLMPSYPF